MCYSTGYEGTTTRREEARTAMPPELEGQISKRLTAVASLVEQAEAYMPTTGQRTGEWRGGGIVGYCQPFMVMPSTH